MTAAVDRRPGIVGGYRRTNVRSAGGVGSAARVFVFFSNRLGCVGSLMVSLVATLVLILLLKACNG
jgi:hypothetical protein